MTISNAGFMKGISKEYWFVLSGQYAHQLALSYLNTFCPGEIIAAILIVVQFGSNFQVFSVLVGTSGCFIRAKFITSLISVDRT